RNSIKGYQKRIDRLKGYMEKLNTRNQTLKEKYEVLQSKLRENSLTELDRVIAEKNDALVNVSNRLIQVNDSVSTLQARLTGESEPKLTQVKEAISKNLKQIGDDEAFLASSQKELLEIGATIDVNRVKLAELETRLGEVRGLVEKDEGQGRLEEQKRLKLMGEIGSLKNEITKIEAEKEKIGIRRNELKDQLNGMGVTPYEFDDNTSVMLGLLEAELNELSTRLNRIAERDYKEMYTSYRDASIRRGELEKDRDAIVKFINEIDSQKRAVFIKAYEEIDKEFRVIFRKITSGEAWLELESIDDPFSGGLFIMGSFGNTPARESASLSGGEKSVISVAFLMALQSSYPSPFYLFDEIDANMDARYTNSLGNLLREWGQKSQLIVVTLRDLVASKANNVIGVYRKDGDSSVARLNMEEINNVI
ncbi:MAG: AAA family ATPase, partial [Nitrososphaerota archaeon]|nr:AAA family ATPase [Nitrososphaerota archaeon]